ncbi:hypothetical protein [Azomonas macrocytogenes]|uniref:Uncharacterized protein n=1 Tax=Azomonas macrocytogenes TaxID=69962 RepID=A0A839T8B7_AZOMA|nr:hypothetical protein [Azomonas macrocytogenes]MBB3104225.1 hypothetical protein [Azomonas macrocytogenes]
MARWLANMVGEPVPENTWSETVAWAKANPEPLARLIQHANGAFQNEQCFGLIGFDALDRTSSDWARMDGIVRDLPKVVLWLKPYSNLHAKAFLREDQSDRRYASIYARPTQGGAWSPDLRGECLILT